MREMLGEMTASEFAEWRAYFEILASPDDPAPAKETLVERVKAIFGGR